VVHGVNRKNSLSRGKCPIVNEDGVDNLWTQALDASPGPKLITDFRKERKTLTAVREGETLRVCEPLLQIGGLPVTEPSSIGE
jgi:hypothetical protein